MYVCTYVCMYVYVCSCIRLLTFLISQGSGRQDHLESSQEPGQENHCKSRHSSSNITSDISLKSSFNNVSSVVKIKSGYLLQNNYISCWVKPGPSQFSYYLAQFTLKWTLTIFVPRVLIVWDRLALNFGLTLVLVQIAFSLFRKRRMMSVSCHVRQRYWFLWLSFMIRMPHRIACTFRKRLTDDLPIPVPMTGR